MKENSEGASSWPTPLQLLLLKATLGSDGAALAAWESWAAQVEIETLVENETVDYASLRILPFLYVNLLKLQVNHPWMETLKTVYRQTWYHNQRLLCEAETLLRVWQSAGINGLLLKGIPLNILYYPDHGLRSMVDADVMVPAQQIPLAIDLMRQQGWRSQDALAEGFQWTERHFRWRHGHEFINPTQQALDLHWRLMPESRDPVLEAVLWQRAVPLSLGTLTTQTLCPEHHLLHICVHGTSWSHTPPIHWIVDAVNILQTSPDLDWDHLLEITVQFQQVPALQYALSFLKSEFQMPIPDPVIQKLQAIKVSPKEIQRYQSRLLPPLRKTPWGQLIHHYQHYLMTQPYPPSAWEQVWGFPAFLKRFWQLNHLANVPAAVLKKGLIRAWLLLDFT